MKRILRNLTRFPYMAVWITAVIVILILWISPRYAFITQTYLPIITILTIAVVVIVRLLLHIRAISSIDKKITKIRELAHRIEERDFDHLSPISTNDMPIEVVPILEAMNSLIARLDEVYRYEREFTSNASHELRTPLAGIRLQAQVAMRAKEDAAREAALKNIINGTDRATRLIEQLLAFARLSPQSIKAQSTTFDLCATVKSVVAELSPLALEKNIQLTYADAEETLIRGYEGGLIILINNLVTNAINHIPENSTVDIALTQTENKVILSVADNGPGIAPEERKKVLQRFYKPNSKGGFQKGSGLGLAIVKRIADLHNADIVLDTPATGSGLVIRVTFPRPVKKQVKS